MYSQSTQKSLILIITLFSFAVSQNCSPLDPFGYGECDTQLGYVWTNSNCVAVSGCSMGADAEYFFNSYEECTFTCFENTSLGDLNNDSAINVIDIVQLVNIILN